MSDTFRARSMKAAGVRFLTIAGPDGPYVRPEQLKAWRSGRTLGAHSDLAAETGSLLQEAAAILADETRKPDLELYQELITLYARAAGQKSDKIFKLNSQTVDTLTGILAAQEIAGDFINSEFFAADNDLGHEAIEALELQGLERIKTYSYHFAPRPAPGSNLSHVFNALPLAVHFSRDGMHTAFERPLEVCNIQAAHQHGLTFQPV